MFEDFGGAPAVVVLDNLKAAVTRASRTDPTVHATYLDMAGHYECKGLPDSWVAFRHLHWQPTSTKMPAPCAASRGVSQALAVVGIDLAKNVFAVHGVSRTGLVELQRPSVKRAKLLELAASWQPCLIGMECCSGALYWAREFEKLGHTARLMAPKFVAPYRMAGKRGKNEANDAEAICEAVTRPNMRFVPIKSVERQAALFVHRARQGYIEERTALINRMRGLLSELGIVLPHGSARVRRGIDQVLGDLPGWCNTVIGDQLSHLDELDQRIAQYDRHVQTMLQQNARACQLMRLSGIGLLTASAMVSTVGNGADFASSRQFSAWLGLTPGQHSSGGKARLGHITKTGDMYLRRLLVLGARAVLMHAPHHTDPVVSELRLD